MKDLLQRGRAVVEISNLRISRCYLADYVKEMYLILMRAARAACTIICPDLTNHIKDLWRCRF